MSDLLKEIKKADSKRELQEVQVPEWGVTVWLKQLTVGERDSFEAEAYAMKENGLIKDIRSKFLARCLCDKDGKPLCKNYQELTTLSSQPMERLFDIAQNYNKLTNEDVEELAKN